MTVPEVLTYGFMQRALLAGAITALICPAIGVFLVPRRLSLIADTLAHVALAGVALGLVAGVSPIVGALVVTAAGAVGIERLRTRGVLAGDASLAVFLSGGLALAVVLIGLGRGFNVDLFAVLFGGILTVTAVDLWLIAGLGIVVAVTISALYPRLLAVTLNEDLARTSGVPVALLNLVITVLTALTTVIAMRMVGVLLVSAMIVIPTLAGFALARSFRGALFIAMALALIAMAIGLILAYYLGLAAGASVVLTALILFALTVPLRRLRAALSPAAAVLAAVALGLAATTSGAHAADKIRVVATIPDLKALTDAVGGDLVDVESLTRGAQNVHDAEIRPTMMLKLRRADLLVENGLELDAWVDVAVQGSNNGRILRGGPGRLDASQNVPVLEIPTGRVDRSLGDVHPLGNPHYTMDPGLAPVITQTLLDGLARLTPQHRATFEKNRAAFLARLDGEMAKWTKAMEPLKGTKVVSYHPDLIYLLTRFGLVQTGIVEDRPGIPPSPANIAQLIRRMKEERIKIVLIVPSNDQKLAARVAQDAGARVVVIAPAVGAVKESDTYLGTIDYNVRTLVEALR